MLFPGQDYNNSRVADFENVQAWTGNEQARTQLGRMPWHDVHTMLTGPAVMDISQFFVERWNFVRDLKYKHNDRFPLLDWPHDDPLNDQMLRHPHTGTGASLAHVKTHTNSLSCCSTLPIRLEGTLAILPRPFLWKSVD